MSKSIVISRVYASEPDLLTREQKFSGGFVANVHPDNADLMRRAAEELNMPITEGEPRKSAAALTYVGIYTDISKHDPQILLQHFFTLLCARFAGSQCEPKQRLGSDRNDKSNAPKSKKGANHGNRTPHPRRRKHTVKTPPGSAR